MKNRATILSIVCLLGGQLFALDNRIAYRLGAGPIEIQDPVRPPVQGPNPFQRMIFNGFSQDRPLIPFETKLTLCKVVLCDSVCAAFMAAGVYSINNSLEDANAFNLNLFGFGVAATMVTAVTGGLVTGIYINQRCKKVRLEQVEPA